MRGDWNRAWEKPRPYEAYIFAVGPVIAAAVVLWLGTRHEADPMTTVVYPTLAFAGVMALLVVLVHFIPHTYRLITGQTPKGRPRTLVGLKALDKIKEQLRDEGANASTWNHVGFTNNTVEIEGFAREFYDLLDECGWRLFTFGQGGFAGAPPRDVQISIPERGSPALEALNELLNKVGYRSHLHHDSAINGGATIQVGERTDSLR